jgi:hypothetical protein
MDKPLNTAIADRFEKILVGNLGQVGRFLMLHQLKVMGKDPSTFEKEDVEEFIQGIGKDFEKVIGYGVKKLEDDLLDSVKEDI